MKIKKLLALVLTLAIVISMLVMPAAAVELSDISKHWAKDSIQRWVDAGIINGYEDGTFKPNGNIKRAEFATILAKAFGLDGVAEVTFSDVEGHWAEDYIYACAAAGIVGGYPDGSFKPENYITRQEAMKMFVGALEFSVSVNEMETSYADLLKEWFIDGDEVQEWAQYYAVAMIAHGAMQGSEQGDGLILRPGANISRAEVAVILDRVMAGYVSATGAVSTTTQAQIDADMMGSRIVVHPDATVKVSGDGTGKIELVSDAGSVTVYREQSSFYVMCDGYGEWIYGEAIEFDAGEMLRYYYHDFEAKRINTSNYIDEDGSEYSSESVTEFIYDEDTWNLEEILVYHNGELITTTTAEFNEDGQIVEVVSNDVVRESYEYNEDGLQVAEIFYREDGTLDYKNEYTYDDNGKTASNKYTGISWWYEPVYDEEGNFVGEERVEEEYWDISYYSYDEEGREIGLKVYNEEDFMITEMVAAYDDNGEIASRKYTGYSEYIDENDEGVAFVNYTEEYVYENGNLVLYIWQYMDLEGTVTGYDKTVTTYDELGRQIMVEYYGMDDVKGDTEYTVYDGDTWRRTAYYLVDAEGNELWKYTYEWTEEDTYNTEKESYYENGELCWIRDSKYSYETNENWGTQTDAEGNVMSTDYSYNKEVDGMWFTHYENAYENEKYGTDTYYHQILLPEDFERAYWEYYRYT